MTSNNDIVTYVYVCVQIYASNTYSTLYVIYIPHIIYTMYITNGHGLKLNNVSAGYGQQCALVWWCDKEGGR